MPTPPFLQPVLLLGNPSLTYLETLSYLLGNPSFVVARIPIHFCPRLAVNWTPLSIPPSPSQRFPLFNECMPSQDDITISASHGPIHFRLTSLHVHSWSRLPLPSWPSSGLCRGPTPYLGVLGAASAAFWFSFWHSCSHSDRCTHGPPAWRLALSSEFFLSSAGLCFLPPIALVAAHHQGYHYQRCKTTPIANSSPSWWTEQPSHATPIFARWPSRAHFARYPCAWLAALCCRLHFFCIHPHLNSFCCHCNISSPIHRHRLRQESVAGRQVHLSSRAWEVGCSLGGADNHSNH